MRNGSLEAEFLCTLGSTGTTAPPTSPELPALLIGPKTLAPPTILPSSSCLISTCGFIFIPFPLMPGSGGGGPPIPLPMPASWEAFHSMPFKHVCLSLSTVTRASGSRPFLRSQLQRITKGQFGSRLQPTRTRPVSDLRILGSKWASMAQACSASLKALSVGNSSRRESGGIVSRGGRWRG